MANPWDNDPIVTPAKAGASAMPWDNDPIVAPAKPGVAEDVAKSGSSGLARGTLGLLGLPGTVAGLVRGTADFLENQTVGRAVNYAKTGSVEAPPMVPTKDLIARDRGFVLPRPEDTISGEALTAQVAKVAPGINYKPQTVPGEYVRTAGEFAPGMLFPGTMAQRVVGGWLAPTIASETAGQATKGTDIEPYARAVAGVGAGVLGAVASRPATAQAAVAGAMGGVDDATVVAAGQLMNQAQQRGVALTWPEAVAQVTGGGATGLTGLQRVVEGSQGGQGVMAPFMAQRPQQIERAGRQAMDTITPPSPAPSTIGPAVGEAAEQTLTDARRIRTNAVNPAYAAAANDAVPAERVNAVIAQLDDIIRNDATGQLSAPAQQMRAQLIERQGTPGTAATRTPVTDPRTGRVIRYETTPAVEATPPVPRTNVAQLDEVYGSARDQFTGPAPLGQTGTEARANRLAGQAVTALDTELQAASPALAAGRQQYQQITRDFIDPLMQGPIGKLASRDTTTREAIETLFPRNPLPNSAPEIIRTVGALAQRNPTAARQIVRAHVETVFNQATRDLQAGANQFGGAGFVAALRGNTQQAENLAAAIQGVGGPQVLQGFDEFLNVVAATGQRQRIGSQTAFNQAIQGELQKGGAVGEAVNAVATAGVKLPGRITKAYEEWRLGQNTEQIARLFTDPNALGMFRRLAQAAPGSSQAQAITARLTSMALQAAQASDTPVPQLR